MIVGIARGSLQSRIGVAKSRRRKECEGGEAGEDKEKTVFVACLLRDHHSTVSHNSVDVKKFLRRLAPLAEFVAREGASRGKNAR